jgi:hypothetical protein
MAQDSVLVTVPLSRLSLVVETVGGVAHLLPEKGTEAPQRCLCSPARTHTHINTLSFVSQFSNSPIHALPLPLPPLALPDSLSLTHTLSFVCVYAYLCTHTHTLTHSLTHTHTHTHILGRWGAPGHSSANHHSQHLGPWQGLLVPRCSHLIHLP